MSSRVLSEEAKKSLTQLSDPFHDYEVECIGLPDGLPEKSIVRKVKKSLTISRPATFPDDETWDCHIFTLPERRYATQSGPTILGQGTLSRVANVYTETSTSHVIGPINIYSVSGGTDSLPGSGPYVAGNVNEQALSLNDYYSGQSRVIASGFEVHDVSSDLYKQGTCTVYRLPQFNYPSNMIPTVGGNAQAPIAGTESRLPPGNIEAAMLLPGSRQWEARWGCYLVDTYDLEENRPRAAKYGYHAFKVGDDDLSGTGSLPTMMMHGTFNTAATALASYKDVLRDTSGAFFTGLSPNSSLTLTYVAVIETFPTFVDPLVTLARSTPEMDPNFFMLYKAIAQEIPSGVMVGENASGDFWDKVLGIISDVAPVLGPAFGPVGGAVGGLISTAAKVGQKTRNEKAAKTKPKRDVTNFTTMNGKPSSKLKK